jgi:hypothetical protein
MMKEKSRYHPRGDLDGVQRKARVVGEVPE